MLVPDESRRYVIVNVVDLPLINFTEVLETEQTVRVSVDGTLAVIKYEGSLPASIAALPSRPTSYTFSEIASVISTPVWSLPEDDNTLYET